MAALNRVAIKTVQQSYVPTGELRLLLDDFRRMLNDCIRIGLDENVTSLKALSVKAHPKLLSYEVMSYYKVSAISTATGILRNYRKALRKGRKPRQPYARRAWLTTCYGFKEKKGLLQLPIQPRRRIGISLNRHTQKVLDDHNICSVTITPDKLAISYSKEVTELRPNGWIGVDCNLQNATIATNDGTIFRYDLSKTTVIGSTYRVIKSGFKRNDARVRRRIYQKYGRKQRNRVKQILHRASKKIVEVAKSRNHGIVMEKLVGIRALYQKGNGLGANQRAKMNCWSFREMQRQIEYKACWEGVPVIYLHPGGTSSDCVKCGSRMSPEEHRTLRCPSCGGLVDRDANAARNLAARGLRLKPVGLACEAMVAEPAPNVAMCTMRQSAESMSAR